MEAFETTNGLEVLAGRQLVIIRSMKEPRLQTVAILTPERMKELGEKLIALSNEA